MKCRWVFLIAVGASLAAATAWQVRRLNPAPATSGGAPNTPPVRASAKVVAEGRLMPYPGARVSVRSEILGTITRFQAREKAEVRQGDLLLELRADDWQAELAEAQARVTEAKASLELAQSEQARGERLHRAAVNSPDEWDRLRHRTVIGQAQLAAAQATVSRLEALLAKTRVRAPIDGTVLIRHAHPGETVEAGAPLVTIADLRRVRVEAEVDEFDTGQVAVGDTVKILAEAYPGRCWLGTVEEIPDHVVDRNLRPEDPGRPSDARVLMVKIALAQETPLKLGQRVEVEIACRGTTAVSE